LFDLVDGRLKDWVLQIIGPAEISLDVPGKAQSGKGVSLYLFELSNAFPAIGTSLPPLKLELHYLVTTWAEQPEEAHNLIGRLAFAALANSGFEVDLNPLPVETWRAFATAPRPAFVLRVPVSSERPATPAKPVTQPLVIHLDLLTEKRE
jgi:hypothetical protein